MLTQLNALLWGKGMTLALIVSALFFTRLVPFGQLGKGFRKVLGDHAGRDAFFTALAGTLGIGGMAGVAAAIALGGAGAVFWMGVSALAGMVLKYVEVTLSCKTQVKTAQGWRGGAMVLLEKTHHPLLALCFCVCCMMAAFGTGALVPAFSVGEALRMALDIPPWLSAALFTLAAALVLCGKSKAVLRANRILIPLAALSYIALCLWIIFTHVHALGTVCAQIMREAFDLSAAFGGGSGFALGRAVRYGVSRGIFSHEAGMGSAPLAYASQPVDDPDVQGCMGIAEVFVDTFVICMLTAFVVLILGGEQGSSGMMLMMSVFTRALGRAGAPVAAAFIVLFAFPCVLGWYYYASQCLTYLSDSVRFAHGYRLVFLGMLALGASMGPQVWELSDAGNGCMTALNLLALFLARRFADP